MILHIRVPVGIYPDLAHIPSRLESGILEPNQFESLPTASAACHAANSGDRRLSLQWE